MSQISEKNLGFALALQEDASLPSSKRITLIEKDVPELKKGQVLVKMLASPVNPSDFTRLTMDLTCLEARSKIPRSQILQQLRCD